MRHPIILIVDDEPLRMRSHVEFLEANGFLVDFVTDISSARTRIADDKRIPAAVVLDLIMPNPIGGQYSSEIAEHRRPGLLLLAEIRKSLPGVPVVICSVIHDSATIKRAEVMGAASYLTKPVLPSTLADELWRVVTRDARSHEDS